MQNIYLIVTEFSATVHLMMSFVLFYFSRRSVKFLPQAWIMLIFFGIYCSLTVYFAINNELPQLGILHPVMLMYLLACSYLQSVQPLGICMPGYLQWQRMCKYATPALLIIGYYVIASVLGARPIKVYNFEHPATYLLSGDAIMRIITLGLSAYYIINIFRLPKKLVQHFILPRYILTYISAVGMTAIFFITLTIFQSKVGLIVYILLFTSVNLFLFVHMIRPSVKAIAYPTIKPVVLPPSEKEILSSEINDFNEANLHRFEAIEYIMQNERPFTDSQFNRDKLCRLSGFNRHIVLQTLRSQGYNDIHEYIARYRINELKRLIQNGDIKNPQKQHERVGFRTTKTTLLCFEKYEGMTLQEWMAQQSLPYEKGEDV